MTLQDDFWSDPQHAQTLIRQLNGIKDITIFNKFKTGNMTININ